MNKFTKGPWQAGGNWDVNKVLSTDGGDIICDCSDAASSVEDDSEREANAHLIAAAPELLEQLEIARRFVQPKFRQVLLRIDAALAKARGET